MWLVMLDNLEAANAFLLFCFLCPLQVPSTVVFLCPGRKGVVLQASATLVVTCIRACLFETCTMHVDVQELGGLEAKLDKMAQTGAEREDGPCGQADEVLSVQERLKRASEQQ